MILPDAFAIQHARGGWLVATENSFRLIWNPLAGGRWTQDNAEKLLPLLPAVNVDATHLTVVPAPACCCGISRSADLALVQDDDGHKAIRCAKHVGRLPCIIEGCGRTFKMDPGEGYSVVTCCGRHWRMAPRYMRDRARFLRKKAEKMGWGGRAGRLHHIAWHRCIAAINRRGDIGGEGHIDIAEIERMFGL